MGYAAHATRSPVLSAPYRPLSMYVCMVRSYVGRLIDTSCEQCLYAWNGGGCGVFSFTVSAVYLVSSRVPVAAVGKPGRDGTLMRMAIMYTRRHLLDEGGARRANPTERILPPRAAPPPVMPDSFCMFG